MYKGKGEKTESKNYSSIRLLSVVGKIYSGILLDRVCRVTGGLIEDEQGGFRAGRWCVAHVVPLKQIDEKAQEEERREYVGFMNLEKV